MNHFPVKGFEMAFPSLVTLLPPDEPPLTSRPCETRERWLRASKTWKEGFEVQVPFVSQKQKGCWTHGIENINTSLTQQVGSSEEHDDDIRLSKDQRNRSDKSYKLDPSSHQSMLCTQKPAVDIPRGPVTKAKTAT
jgi:hypothetical protein